jgi:hypothetical protein
MEYVNLFQGHYKQQLVSSHMTFKDLVGLFLIIGSKKGNPIQNWFLCLSKNEPG